MWSMKMNLSIKEIIKACAGKVQITHKNENMNVTGVVLDSRKVQEGSVFVATPGERVDGHKFIADVFEKGASLVIGSRIPEDICTEYGFAKEKLGAYITVEDAFKALVAIATYYRQKLTIPVVGITGSVGKTSTKEFVAGVLSAKYKVLKTEGNFNNEIGVPLTLLRIGSEHEAAVIEMGISDFGEMHRLSEMVKPTVCLMTNIGHCHLENLGDRDGVLRAKSEIFDFMQEDGYVCLNIEDDKLSALQEIKGKKPYFFGFHPCFSYMDHVESKGLWGSKATLQIDGESLEVDIPLPGRHMVLNAAAGACVGKLLGLTAQEIKKGIAGVTPVSGRNNLIRTKNYTVVDDCYNANPASMRSSIDLLKMANTMKVAILGDMFELGETSDALHEGVGTYAAEAMLDRIICVGENSRHMYEAAKKTASDSCEVLYFKDRESVLKAIEEDRKSLIPDGCTVLLKASHGMQFGQILDLLTKN